MKTFISIMLLRLGFATLWGLGGWAPFLFIGSLMMFMNIGDFIRLYRSKSDPGLLEYTLQNYTTIDEEKLFRTKLGYDSINQN